MIPPPTVAMIIRFLEDCRFLHIHRGRNLPHVIAWYDQAIALLRSKPG